MTCRKTSDLERLLRAGFLMSITWDLVSGVTGFAANVVTVTVSLGGLYLFVTKRQAISTVFRLLLGYSWRLTLVDLSAKLEKINDLHVDSATDSQEVISLLGEILGHIRGNPMLRQNWPEIRKKLTKYVESGAHLDEPRKRAVVSEIREGLRHVDISNYKNQLGDQE